MMVTAEMFVAQMKKVFDEANAKVKARRSRAPEGECAYCDAHHPSEMMPHHDASPRCESGKRNHCTCDTCF